VTAALPDAARADAASADPTSAGVALAEDDAAFEGPLFDAFAAVAARQPDHPAVDDGTTRLSYAELCDRALQLGARIAVLVPADGLVGVLVPISVRYPVAWLACLAARRPFLPLDPQLPPARNQAIIAEAGLAAVIVPTAAADLAAWLPAALPRIPMAMDPGPAAARLPAGRPPSSVGMVVFTSGSTGRARGIALHERATQRRAMIDRVTCELGPGDRLLSLHPPPTSAGARDTFGALLSGACLHLLDLKHDGLACALALLRGGGISVFTTVPAVARALMALDGAAVAFRGLRIVRLGGDSIMGSDIATLARLLAPTARILVSFGMTEAGILLERLIDPRAPVETGRIAMGTPVAGQTVSVEAASGDPVRPGETGRLVIRGRYVALGHWVAGRLDPGEFAADPSAPGSRCFRSADVVLLRPDGMLVPLGRADRQVKINGMRIEPEETEAALRGLPGVADAAVLVHGDTGAPMLVAFVVPAPKDHALMKDAPLEHASKTSGMGPTTHNAIRLARGWRSALATLLPPQQVPTRIRVVPAIPLLPSLKPNLAALRALLAEEDTQGMLALIWARLRDGWPRVLAARVQPTVRQSDIGS
jgi:non-ribosomal peptide synthetase component F